MKVSAISFKGYREFDTVLKHPDPLVINALNEARPYLRQIGESMPYPRDLAILVTEDPCDTYVKAYDYNKKAGKSKLLASENEHTLTEHGLDFVDKVFKGLRNNCNEKEFKDIASNFVSKFYFIMWEQHPIKLSFNSDDICF